MTKRPFFPTVAALALCASLAQATTILTFDDIPGGAGGGTLTNQYQDENFLVSQGQIDFAPSDQIGISPFSPPNTAGVSLPVDLDTASSQAATTSAGTSAATVRDKLYPKCAVSAVKRGAAGAAQCIHAGLRRARGCGGVSR